MVYVCDDVIIYRARMRASVHNVMHQTIDNIEYVYVVYNIYDQTLVATKLQLHAKYFYGLSRYLT